MKIYLRGGPKDGQTTVLRVGTDYWSFADNPEEPEMASLAEVPEPIGEKTWRMGVYKDSGHKLKNQFGGIVPVFTWQGWQE